MLERRRHLGLEAVLVEREVQPATSAFVTRERATAAATACCRSRATSGRARQRGSGSHCRCRPDRDDRRADGGRGRPAARSQSAAQLAVAADEPHSASAVLGKTSSPSVTSECPVAEAHALVALPVRVGGVENGRRMASTGGSARRRRTPCPSVSTKRGLENCVKLKNSVTASSGRSRRRSAGCSSAAATTLRTSRNAPMKTQMPSEVVGSPSDCARCSG